MIDTDVSNSIVKRPGCCGVVLPWTSSVNDTSGRERISFNISIDTDELFKHELVKVPWAHLGFSDLKGILGVKDILINSLVRNKVISWNVSTWLKRIRNVFVVQLFFS